MTGRFFEANWSTGSQWVETPFAGTITPDGKVNLALQGSNVTLTGSLVLSALPYAGGRLTLTYHGGPHDGATVSMYQNDPY